MNKLGDVEIEIMADPEGFHKMVEELRISLVEGLGNVVLPFQWWVNSLAAANASRDTVVNVSYVNMHETWFEVKTFADPTHVEMRKLSGEEAEQAQKEYEKQQTERIAAHLRFYHPEWFEDMEQSVIDFVAIADSLTLPDKPVLGNDKAAARVRSREDVRKKRKDVMRRRKL